MRLLQALHALVMRVVCGKEVVHTGMINPVIMAVVVDVVVVSIHLTLASALVHAVCLPLYLVYEARVLLVRLR